MRQWIIVCIMGPFGPILIASQPSHTTSPDPKVSQTYPFFLFSRLILPNYDDYKDSAESDKPNIQIPAYNDQDYPAEKRAISAVFPKYYHWPHLRTLFLHHRGLKHFDFSALAICVSLRILDLSHNFLEELIVPSTGAPPLRVLMLRHNKLSDKAIIPLSRLTTLETLFLSDNENIRTIPHSLLTACRNLQAISLHRTSIPFEAQQEVQAIVQKNKGRKNG